MPYGLQGFILQYTDQGLPELTENFPLIHSHHFFTILPLKLLVHVAARTSSMTDNFPRNLQSSSPELLHQGALWSPALKTVSFANRDVLW